MNQSSLLDQQEQQEKEQQQKQQQQQELQELVLLKQNAQRKTRLWRKRVGSGCSSSSCTMMASTSTWLLFLLLLSILTLCWILFLSFSSSSSSLSFGSLIVTMLNENGNYIGTPVVLNDVNAYTNPTHVMNDDSEKTTTSTTTTTTSKTCSKDHHYDTHPILCQMLQELKMNPDAMAKKIHNHALQHNLLVGHTWPVVTTTRQEHVQQQQEEEKPESWNQSIRRRRHRILQNQQQHNQQQQQQENKQLPVVIAHGMGDSCFNSGMQKVVEYTRQLLSSNDHNNNNNNNNTKDPFVICIPIGSNQVEDTNNGYFLNMNANVDAFAQAIVALSEKQQEEHEQQHEQQQDDQEQQQPIVLLQNGFHAIGFSQGCNVVRGYIAKYNTTPPVHSFLSINGVNAGQGAVPHCRPTQQQEQQQHTTTTRTIDFCELLMEQTSKAAYTEFAQEHSFQANYWRDPRSTEFPIYQQYSQLAIWNNEAKYIDKNDGIFWINETLRQNWNRTKQFIWILANQDTMVIPKEGEHWLAPNPNDPFGPMISRNKTDWYIQDTFGLQTADQLGKNFWHSFDGDHLQFTMQEYAEWVTMYLKQ